MTIFLTSSFDHFHIKEKEKIANEINNTNKIINQIKENLKDNKNILYIASDNTDIEKCDEYSKLLFESLKISGIEFKKYNLLDDRTKHNAKSLIEEANLIFLSGGDTYKQNCFIKEIKLKELLENFNGIIIGQSAGSINMAENAFNSPETKDETDQIYFKGLGLTDINVEPHFKYDSSTFDEDEIYQRNYILKESNTRPLLGLCDGSHIVITDKETVIYGESYLIQNQIIDKICNNNESYEIQKRNKKM